MKISYLAEEPSSLSASSSNLLNAAFFSSAGALKNSLTRASRASTVPAWKEKQSQIDAKIELGKDGLIFPRTLEVSWPFASRLVPHFSLMKLTKSSKSLPPS